MRPFDASGAFAPSVPRGGKALRSLAVRGAGMNIFSGVMSLGIQVAATVVLGRILAPRDFGLVAMVLTFSMLLANTPNNGFIDAILQRKEINESLASNLFWISTGIAVTLTGLFALAAPLVARFYNEQTVIRIAVALSLQILLTCAPTVHAALLRRAMLFPSLAMNDIVARAMGVVTSIVLGLAGWSYWALVAGQLMMSLSTAVGVWILCAWMPKSPAVEETRDALRFAGHIGVRYSINYFVRNFDNLLVGWRFGANPLGYYKKAYDLFAMPMTQLVSANANVAVSALSRVRDDRAQWTRYVLGALGMLAFIGMALAGDLTLIGKDVIRVLLGPNWGTAGWIFTFFAPAIGIMMVSGVHGWIHVSLGHAERWLKWGIFEWAVTCALFLAGLPWGPQGVAVAWSASFWALTLPSLWYAGRPVDFGVMPVVRAIWRYIVASLAASVAAYAVLAHSWWLRNLEDTAGALLRIVCVTATFGVLYLAAVVVLHRGPAPLRTMVTLIGELRGRRRPATVANNTSRVVTAPSVE
ncbi:lipopolysaccharide biosynthesis protein [Occallatibacter riparius]|uniref:Lipopolysaccharide biosynthesis protein n=1 Tax=Occallatibacter riparius TaxID=1002689 RepID=A0A9J7BVN6_9BACT|nr:lipopolysaccharide biosynthesis protein [Occallatibacter riparius]UWZ86932.1 lipopolysaccharide biosynthesis protein [Occallatibacter riparius]